MSFLHLQLAIAGLACIGIPILIHLLMRRRRKPVMWGAMRFLLEAYKKHRRRLMIEKWLLLAARCLLVALLGLAIGRPLVGAILGGGTGRTVYILIDNGLAAGAIGADGQSALARHKAFAKKVLDTLQGTDAEGDRVALLALGGPPEGVVLPVSADVPAVAALLETVQAVDSRTDLPSALGMVASAIETDRSSEERRRAGRGQTFVVVLSDFLEGSADLTASVGKLPEGVTVVAAQPSGGVLGGGGVVGGAGGGRPNVAVTGVEPFRSVVVTGKVAEGEGEQGGRDTVRVMLLRSGPGVSLAQTTTVVLGMAALKERGEGTAGGEAGRAEVRWAPGQETATAAIQPRKRAGGAAADRSAGTLTEVIEARIESKGAAENSVPGDDVWRRPVEIRDALRVGVVSPRRFGPRERVDRLEVAEWLRLALRPTDDSPMEVSDLDPTLLDGARLAGLDALCVPRPDLLTAEHWPRLRLFLEGGGLLFITPPADLQVHLWSDALVKELGLDWRVAREARVYGAGGGAPAAIAPGAVVGATRGDLLAAVRRELDELVKPVGVWRVLPVETERPDARRLLSLQDGTPLLLAQTYTGPGSAPSPAELDGAGNGAAASNGTAARVEDRGLVVFLAAAPDLGWTDLPAKPLMVPLLQEVMQEGIGQAHGSWWSIAGARPITPSRSEELRPITMGGGESEPEVEPGVIGVDETGVTSEPLRRAGLWRATDGRGGVRGVVAVNPDTRGSRTGSQDGAAVAEWVGRAAPDGKVLWLEDEGDGQAGGGGAVGNAETGTVTGLLARRSAGTPISMPLLIGALVIALFEVWLARRASHAEVSLGGSAGRKGAAA